MLPLAVMDKEASFAVLSVTPESKLRMRDIEGYVTAAPNTRPKKKQSKQEIIEEGPFNL